MKKKVVLLTLLSCFSTSGLSANETGNLGSISESSKIANVKLIN